MNIEGVTDEELEQIVADDPEVIDIRLPDHAITARAPGHPARATREKAD